MQNILRNHPSSPLPLAALLAGLLAASPLPAAETLVFDQPECAGMSGFRAHWNKPIPVAEDGANNRHPMQAGDLRIVFARTADGKLLATRYRPVVESGPKPLASFFETPAAGKENFDEIAEWNDLKMHYRAVQGGYVLEVAIPWHATSIQPKAGLKFLADVGVIYGNTGGTRNATRAMWSDRTPELNVNNDIPTECRLHPNGWGVVLVEQP